MNTRVMLLLLATAGFAAMWSGDREHQRQILARSTGAQTQTMLFLHSDKHSVEIVANRTSASDESEVLCGLDGCKMRLPADITPGEYRVLNNQGSVRLMTFTAADLSLRGVAKRAVRNCYVVEEGGTRWYFIRVERSEDPLARNSQPASQRQTGSELDLYCTRSKMTHDIVTRSVSEGRRCAPRLRFGLLSELRLRFISESTACRINGVLAALGWLANDDLQMAVRICQSSRNSLAREIALKRRNVQNWATGIAEAFKHSP